MAITYDLSSSDPATVRLARVRLELDDTRDGTGPRPDGRNLSDAEIGVWLAAEADDPLRAAAAACAMLSRAWSREANTQVGQRKEDLAAVAQAWATRGQELRAAAGGGGPGAAFTTGWSRDDGYARGAWSRDWRREP